MNSFLIFIGTLDSNARKILVRKEIDFNLRKKIFYSNLSTYFLINFFLIDDRCFSLRFTKSNKIRQPLI